MLNQWHTSRNWFLLAAGIRLALFAVFAYYFVIDQNIDTTNGLFAHSKDTSGYYRPAETLMQGHGYGSYVEQTGEYVPSAARMPGIVPFYAVFYPLLGHDGTEIAMILVQLLGSILSIWLLGRIAWFLMPSVLLSGLTMLVYAVSSYIGVYDHYGLSESLNITTFIIALYFFVRYLDVRHWKYAFWAGVFLGWSIFIRPVVGYFLVLLPVIKLLWDMRKGIFSWPEAIRSMALFGLAPALFLSAWTWRNYSTFQEIIPLQMNIVEAMPDVYTPHRMACLELVVSMGESTVDFSDYTMGDWFFDDSYAGEFDKSVIPETSVYNRDSIEVLRKQYQLLRFHKINGEEADRLGAIVTGKAKRYTKSLRNERPFYYYVTAKVKLIGHFILHRKLISPFPFPAKAEMNLLQFGIKAFNFLLINVITMLGLLGIVLSLLRGNLRFRLFALLPLSFILVLPVIVGYMEQRYFAHPYILLIPFAMFACMWALAQWKPGWMSGEMNRK